MTRIRKLKIAMFLLLIQTNNGLFAQKETFPPPCGGPGLPPCNTFQDDLPIENWTPYVLVLGVLFAFFFFKQMHANKQVE
jgi:hypothetical protein